MSKALKKLIDINRLREFKNKLVGTGSAYVQTAAVDQTIAGTKTFSKPIAGSVTGSSGSCTGNAATATKATKDAAGNTITTTYATKAENNTKANNSEVVHKSGDETIAGTKTFSDGVLLTNVNALMAQNRGYTLVLRNDGGSTYLLMSDKDGVPGTWSDARPLTISNSTGVCNINGNAATATTATTAEACTGNAATATKLAAKRTIALSGAATGTATAFDGSGNITIPVTALSGSAITSAITIYDLVPDGAANHRNFYRGKDITAAFNDGTVSTNIANGTFRDIFPGDYITKSITVPQILKADGTTEYIAQTAYNVRFIIADLDVWLNRGDTATTAHHVAIVPQSVVFGSCMNETNTTGGGYLGSFMNTNVMPAFATGLQNAFGSAHILQFRFLDTKAVNNDLKSGGIVNYTGATYWSGHDWTSHYCHLMTETMVYGAPITASCAVDEIMGGVQFAAFRLNSNLVYNRQNYWLSDVVSSTHFADVYGAGNAGPNSASAVGGVRPFALLV